MFWNPKIECMPKEELKALQYRELACPKRSSRPSSTAS